MQKPQDAETGWQGAGAEVGDTRGSSQLNQERRGKDTEGWVGSGTGCDDASRTKQGEQSAPPGLHFQISVAGRQPSSLLTEDHKCDQR